MVDYYQLSHHDRRVYRSTVMGSRRAHRRRIEVHLLTLDGGFVASMTPKLYNGSVTVDVESSPSRTLQLQIIDQARSLVFEPTSGGEMPSHRKYQLKIVDARLIARLDNEWVDVTVFTGPIRDFARQGAVVSLTADGAERLAMGTVRKARAWLRRTKMTDVIIGLLQAAGAQAIVIPDLPKTTSVHVHVGTTHHERKGKDGKMHHATQHFRHVKGFVVHKSNTYWEKASVLGSALNRHLYADSYGVFRLRPHPERPVFHFTEDMLLGDVELSRPASDAPNTWVVQGGKPKGHKRKVSSGLVGLPHAHPLSAYSLAWHGEPAQVLEQTSNPHLKTKKACRAVAIRKRDRAAKVLAEASFDAVPFPPLAVHELDMVSAQAGWGIANVVIGQLTYPITMDESPMTVGAVKRAHPRRRVSSHGTS